MFEYGKTVIKYMFHENDEQVLMDLEGSKTGGREVSRNTFSIENMICNQDLN